MPFTSDETAAFLEVICQIPTANGALSRADLLGILTSEMRTTLLAVVRKSAGEFYVKDETAAIVVNQSDYRIPARAQTATLRDLKIRSTQQPSPQNLSAAPVPYVSLERSDSFRNSGSYNWPSGTAHTIIGDMIRILPMPTQANYQLLIRYFMRQSALVPVASCARVTVIAGTLVTFANVPATWSVANLFDAQQAAPNFDLLDWDITANAVVTGAGGTISFATNGLPPGLVVGDYVCLAGETCVVQLPAEFHPALVSSSEAQVLKTLGDREGANIAQAKYLAQINDIKGLLEPRNLGEPGKILNRYSPLRRNRRWGF